MGSTDELYHEESVTGLDQLHVLLQALRPQDGVQEEACAQLLNHVRLSVTLGTVACQAPLPVGFSRQERWSGLQSPSPRFCLSSR